MIIHGQTFTPSDVTHLVIAYTGPNGTGLLDLTGPAAAAAMREIARHHRPASGKPRGAVPVLPARILRHIETTHPATVHSAAESVGCSVGRARAIVAELVEAGEVVEGDPLPSRRGSPMKTYKAASHDS
jgi:hypothetical protein